MPIRLTWRTILFGDVRVGWIDENQVAFLMFYSVSSVFAVLENFFLVNDALHLHNSVSMFCDLSGKEGKETLGAILGVEPNLKLQFTCPF